MCLSAVLSGASNGFSSLESQMDTATEENESTPTITVTWAKKSEQGQRSRIKKETNGSQQMVLKQTAGKES